MMYLRMMPLSLSGGSQETNTAELLEAAAFTPAGGPGTAEEERRPQEGGQEAPLASGSPTVLLGADVDLLAADAVPGAGEGQHLDAVVGVLLQAVQLQRRLHGRHVADFPQFCRDDRKRWLRRSSQIIIIKIINMLTCTVNM